MATVSGRIIRDISSQPNVIDFGNVTASGGKRILKLISESGAKIEVLSIESSMPNSISAKIASAKNGCVEVVCSFNPKPPLGRVFSGYLLLRVMADREQTIKILFYGENAEIKGGGEELTVADN